MKVLVVSLLRLGDFLMLAPVLRGLKEQRGVKELHVLVHPEALHLKNLFPDVDQWHVIDRKQLQNALGMADTPFLLAHDLLLNCVSALSKQKFDSVINLTHTEFSGWVCGAIETKDRLGLHYDFNGKPQIFSPWFHYLNTQVAGGGKDVFHMTDIFFHAAGLTGEPNWHMPDTEQGLKEASSFQGSPYIALQTLTSDLKKNWSVGSWVSAMVQMQTVDSKLRFVMLGAPPERERLDGLCQMAHSRGVNVELAICSMEGALAIIRGAQLLVTGDTSIKHLACATDTPVLEICLGSSDYRKTGVYKQDSVILQSRVGCAPCPHSRACNQSSHRCGESLTPEVVALTALHLRHRQFSEIRKIAQEFEAETTCLQTHISPMGFWLGLPLTELSENWLLQTVLEKSTWKFVLHREYLKPLAQFGSESLRIKLWLEKLNGLFVPRLNQGLDFIESETSAADHEINALLKTVRRLTESGAEDLNTGEGFESLKNFFEREHAPILPWLMQLNQIHSSPGVVPITGLRKVQSHLDEVFQKVQVKLKLIRSLKSQLVEKT